MAIAAALSGMAPACANAAGLGRLSVQSGLGQPLSAQVEVTSLGREEIGSLSARLAPVEAFRQAGLEYNPALASLRFAIERKPSGGALIRITSSQAIREPFVDLLLELNWDSGKFVREYTFLLDPPELRIGAQAVEGGRSTTESIVMPAAAQAATAQPARGATVTAAPLKAPSATSAQSGPKARASAARTPSANPQPQPANVAAPAPDSVLVRAGDTLDAIAARVKPTDIALEQAVMAIYSANPKAFFGTVHQLLAGSTLQIPDHARMAAVDAANAKREIRAQAADFNAYRARLAAEARRVEPARAGRSIAGSVGAKVDDKAAPAASGDQLKLSRSGPANASPADATSATGATGARGNAGAESQIAREAALHEQQERVAALERNVADLQQLIELKNRQLAELQRQVEAARSAGKAVTGTAGATKAAESAQGSDAAKAAAAQVASASPAAAAAPASQADSSADTASSKAAAPAAAGQESSTQATKGAAAPAGADQAAAGEAATSPGAPASGADAASGASDTASNDSATPAAASSEPADAAASTNDAKSAAPDAAASGAPAATGEPKKPTPTPAPEPSVLEALMNNPLALPAFAAIALGIGAYGLYAVRRRRKSDEFEDSLSSADAFTANSLFGSTGGQAVDTHNSLFATSARDSGVDVHSTEVDPIAEAEVYIAYGREAQAEEILKEALKRQPERQAIRLKLLEIHAARKDVGAFGALAQDMYDLAGGLNEEWPKVVTLGLSIDPTNALYTGLGDGAVAPADAGQAAAQAPQARASSPAADLGEAAGAAAAMFGETLHDAGGAARAAPAAGPFAETVPMDGEPERTDEMPALDFDLDLEPATGKSDAAVPPAARADFGAGSADGESPAHEPSDLERAIDGRFELPSLDLDLGTGSSEAADPASSAGQARAAHDDEPPALADLGDFKIDLPSLEDIDTQPALLDEDEHERPAVDLAGFDGGSDSGNLDLSSSRLGLAPADAAVASDSSRWQEMATKLDLAAAYEEIGDKEGARELLEEVLEGGDIAQQQKARAMLSKIS